MNTVWILLFLFIPVKEDNIIMGWLVNHTSEAQCQTQGKTLIKKNRNTFGYLTGTYEVIYFCIPIKE